MSSRYAVILVKNPTNSQQYLMGIRKDNKKINFPAGGINNNEDPRDGARRELLEETGLKATSLKCIGCYKKEKNSKPIIVYVYQASVDGNPTLEKDPDKEFQSIFWKNPKEIPEKDLHIPTEENSGLKALKNIK